MRLSYVDINQSFMGEVVLCKVKDENEAFMEMNRYLEVNNIESHETSVRHYKISDEHTGLSDVAKIVYFEDDAFMIRFNDEIKVENFSGMLDRKYSLEKLYRRVRKGAVVNVYTEIQRYIEDLTNRGGEVICHLSLLS